MAKKKSKTPSNVTNPSLYQRVKAEAKRKFDVFPSAYASGWIVRTYKKRGGGYKGAKKAMGGEVSNQDLKPIPAKNKGLPKLPKKVRNQMGYMSQGGAVRIQARGCGAIMNEKRKQTKVPRG